MPLNKLNQTKQLQKKKKYVQDPQWGGQHFPVGNDSILQNIDWIFSSIA